MNDRELQAVEKRVRGLMDDGEELHGVIHADETPEGHYVLVVREWAHPDGSGATILSERYAYLTKDRTTGSDGWVEGGVNRRNTHGAEMSAALARTYTQTAVKQRTGRDEPHREAVESED